MIYAILLLAAPPPPPPGTVKPAPGPSLELAMVMARAAIAACHDPVAVSVVDSSGKAKVTLAADGFGGNPATSVKKGAAAALLGEAGSWIEQRLPADAGLAAKVTGYGDMVNVHAGSVPWVVDGKVLGGIGVTGATTHEGDESCARAGLPAGH